MACEQESGDASSEGEMIAPSDDAATGAYSPDVLVGEMSSFLASLDAFAVHIEVNFDDVLRDGTKVQYAGAGDITLRRPDGLYIDYADDLSSKEVWYDGQSFTMYDRLHGIYTVIPTESRLEDAINHIESEFGVVLPIATLFRENPASRIGELSLRERYLGIHDVDGIPSHHILFQGERADWQMWIEAGTRPIPRKMVITYREEPSSPQNTIMLTDWNVDDTAEGDPFTANVPADAVRATALELTRREP